MAMSALGDRTPVECQDHCAQQADDEHDEGMPAAERHRGRGDEGDDEQPSGRAERLVREG